MWTSEQRVSFLKQFHTRIKENGQIWRGAESLWSYKTKIYHFDDVVCSDIQWIADDWPDFHVPLQHYHHHYGGDGSVEFI